MFVDRHTCEEVKSVQARLHEIERQEYGRRIEELREDTRELGKAHRDKTDELQKAGHKLAVRLGALQGIAAVLFAVLSGVVVYYIDRYQAEADRGRVYAERSREFDEFRREAYEMQVGMFQDKFGDTLDRVSLFAPTEEDKTLVTEVDALRQKLSRLGVASDKFDALSELTSALKLIVNEGRVQEASEHLDRNALTVSSDRFVASRALVLQAMTLVQPSQQCVEPERTIKLLSSALRKDSGVAAAFNLLGVCQAEQSRESMSERPEDLQHGGELLQTALRNSEFAYQFKPTQWSRARLLNNRIWEASSFMMAALKQNQVDEALPWIGEKTIQEFFERAARDLEECQLLDERQPSYLETLAELHGLACAVYRSPSHRDDRRAAEAYEKMVQALAGAINKGLLRKRNAPGEAEKYFSDDGLLAPLFAEPGNPRSIDPRIKSLIEQRAGQH